MLALKCLKRQVAFNPPKKTYLHYPRRQRPVYDRPTNRTAQAANTIRRLGRHGSDDGTASAASAVRRLNAGGSSDRVLAPFNEVAG